MKFMYFFLPTLPATLEERKRLRPIALQPERWQQMIDNVVEITQLAERRLRGGVLSGASPA